MAVESVSLFLCIGEDRCVAFGLLFCDTYSDGSVREESCSVSRELQQRH